MGFDVLYFPPIHPIGHSRRKGRNNAPVATAGDPGSPYAIGTAEGGHDALHPELGTGLTDGPGFIARESEPQLDHLALGLGQRRDDLGDLLLAHALGHLVDGLGPITLQ